MSAPRKGTAPEPGDKAAAAAGELRELTREAHGILGDLRAAVRTAKTETATLAADALTAKVEELIAAEMARLRAAVDEAIAAAVAQVHADFDELGKALMGDEVYWVTAAGRKGTAPVPGNPLDEEGPS